VVETTARFALQGRGTPAPWAPPERFVERGSYRFVRSPMYLGVLLLVVGQGLLLGRPVLYAWALAAWLMFTGFLAFYEEPQLRGRFGASYDDYRSRVRRWLPTRPRSSRY
jgi:protein-S-isoprenylcysteine O-methyltransferase Ste14